MLSTLEQVRQSHSSAPCSQTCSKCTDPNSFSHSVKHENRFQVTSHNLGRKLLQGFCLLCWHPQGLTFWGCQWYQNQHGRGCNASAKPSKSSMISSMTDAPISSHHSFAAGTYSFHFHWLWLTGYPSESISIIENWKCVFFNNFNVCGPCGPRASKPIFLNHVRRPGTASPSCALGPKGDARSKPEQSIFVLAKKIALPNISNKSKNKILCAWYGINLCLIILARFRFFLSPLLLSLLPLHLQYVTSRPLVAKKANLQPQACQDFHKLV